MDNQSKIKSHLGSASVGNLIDRPPGLNYSIDFATPEETKFVISRNLAEGRQVMNLTVSPYSQLFILKDLDSDGKIAGWSGLDLEFSKNYPESFSCFLDDGYRNYLLWLVLEQARCDYAQTKGFKSLFVRMDSEHNSELVQKRLESGIYVQLKPENLEKPYLSLCTKCRLHKNGCEEQAYFQVSIDKMLKHVEKRMGITAEAFPRHITLKPELMRERDLVTTKFVPMWKPREVA